MNLQLIKELSAHRKGGLKRLAEDAGMSEANLHRCIRNNRIEATRLKKIASLLNTSVGSFFGEVSIIDNQTSLQLKHMEELLAEKERLI